MSHKRYLFYFSIPNYDKPVLYSFHTDVTIKFFIEFIKEEMRYFSQKNIEIFETFDHKSKKIDYDESYTLNELYGDREKETSFHVKFIDSVKD